MESTYPFRNLVMQGGGIKCFAYHGALYVLEERGLLDQIRRVAGTSAGAMTAAVLSFRLSVDDTLAIMRTLDYGKVPRMLANSLSDWTLKPPKGLEQGVEKVLGNMDAAGRLIQRYGWYSSDTAHNWLQEIIADQCDGNGMATFGEFRERDFRDLHVVATNLTTHSQQLFSADTTPHVAVADALLISQSIPLFFEAPRFDGRELGKGDFYTDGGVVNNYPLHLFDDDTYRTDNPWFVHGINWRTVGLRLYTPDDCPEPTYHRPINSIVGFVVNLFETYMVNQDVAYSNRPADRARSVEINDCCVQPTDFRIRPVEDDETYCKQVASGRKAMEEYLEHYSPPDLSQTNSDQDQQEQDQ